MGLGETGEALDLQDSDATSMAPPFDERTRMMVDYACRAKRASSVKRLVQRARCGFRRGDGRHDLRRTRHRRHPDTGDRHLPCSWTGAPTW